MASQVTRILIVDITKEIRRLQKLNQIKLNTRKKIKALLPSMSLHMNIFLSSYRGGDFGKVKMENQVSSEIVGIGDITLITNTGCKLMLKDTRHVSDMCLNLISVGKLDDAGFVNHFGGGIWKFTKGSLIIARGKK